MTDNPRIEDRPGSMGSSMQGRPVGGSATKTWSGRFSSSLWSSDWACGTSLPTAQSTPRVASAPVWRCVRVCEVMEARCGLSGLVVDADLVAGVGRPHAQHDLPGIDAVSADLARGCCRLRRRHTRWSASRVTEPSPSWRT